MNDIELANRVRDAVARLNNALREAAQANLSVELKATTHQTTGGAPQAVVEARIYKAI